MATRFSSPSRWTLLLTAAVLGTPAVLWSLFALSEPAPAPLADIGNEFRTFSPSTLPLLRRSIGPEPTHRPRITHVQIIDFDQDGLADLLVCDAQRQRVFWYRQEPSGQAGPRGRWTEIPVSDEVPAPAHTAVADLDGDGDRDIVVAVLGSVVPTHDHVGKVAWLENLGGKRFKTHVLVDDLRRVTDVQPGDLNDDGRLDLVVAEFGHDHGKVFWMENVGAGGYTEHELWMAPGAIHVPLADFDGDGDLDIVALVSQEDEEVWAFENQGAGAFQPRPVFSTINFDFGAVGLVLTDLDRDGRHDLLLAAGDNLELYYPYPQAWHGCLWLKNEGNWKFTPRRIGQLGGAYAASAGDLDGDGDLDVALASMCNDWRRPGSASLVWLENDGQCGFTPWQIADQPTHLATVACGDLDGDGKADIVAGGLHLVEPFNHLGRVSAWLSGKGGTP